MSQNQKESLFGGILREWDYEKVG